jgi:hypothetical protein
MMRRRSPHPRSSSLTQLGRHKTNTQENKKSIFTGFDENMQCYKNVKS